MLRVVAASREGRRVTKVPGNTQEAPVEEVEFGRSEPNPASLGYLSNDDVSLASESAEDLAGASDKVG